MKKVMVLVLFLVLSGQMVLYSLDDESFDMSVNVVPLVLFSAMDVSLEMYFTPHISFNNSLLVYFSAIPALISLFFPSQEAMDENEGSLWFPSLFFSGYHPGNQIFEIYVSDDL